MVVLSNVRKSTATTCPATHAKIVMFASLWVSAPSLRLPVDAVILVVTLDLTAEAGSQPMVPVARISRRSNRHCEMFARTDWLGAALGWQEKRNRN